MVEVNHCVLEALAFLANEIRCRDTNIAKFNICRLGGPPPLRFHPLQRYAWHVLLKQQHAQAIMAALSRICATKNCEVVGLHAAGDPLLRAIDDPNISLTPRRCAD